MLLSRLPTYHLYKKIPSLLALLDLETCHQLKHSPHQDKNAEKVLSRDLTLNGLKWLLSVTRLPVIVKGVLTGMKIHLDIVS